VVLLTDLEALLETCLFRRPRQAQALAQSAWARVTLVRDPAAVSLSKPAQTQFHPTVLVSASVQVPALVSTRAEAFKSLPVIHCLAEVVE
jgi:hypothetical protein